MKKRVFILSSILALTMSTSVFAGSSHSLCVGADLGGKPRVDTSKEAITAATNLVSAGYAPELVINDLGDHRITYDWLNSGVVYLAGHGSANGQDVIWRNPESHLDYSVSTNNLSSGKGRTVNKGTYPNCKLAIIAACYCGLQNGVANAFQKYGADCAIGWTDTVSDVTLRLYTGKLTSQLAEGATIQAAIKAANAYMKDETLNKTYNIDNRVFKYKTYGSGVYNSIKRNKSVDTVNNMDIDKNNPLVYNPDTYSNIFDTYTKVKNENIDYKSRSQQNIESYIIENIDSRFNPDLFEKTEIETIPGDCSDMLITFRYKVGDIISDFGYNINIEDGKMVSYKEIGTDIYGYTLPVPMASADIKEAKLEAFNEKLGITTDKIIEQTIDVIFDSAEKRCKYSVNTVFETSNGGIYSQREYCE